MLQTTLAKLVHREVFQSNNNLFTPSNCHSSQLRLAQGFDCILSKPSRAENNAAFNKIISYNI